MSAVRPIRLPAIRAGEVRLENIPKGKRFEFWTCETRATAIRGTVVGPGTEGGIVVELRLREHGKDVRKLDEWSGAIYVKPA